MCIDKNCVFIKRNQKLLLIMISIFLNNYVMLFGQPADTNNFSDSIISVGEEYVDKPVYQNNTECSKDMDCSGDMICIDGDCVNKSKPAKYSGCHKDTDCKGNRICIDGKCVFPEKKQIQYNSERNYPVNQTQKSIPRAVSAKPFKGVYLEVSSPVTFGTFGEMEIEFNEEEGGYEGTESYTEYGNYSIKGKVLGGIRLAINRVLSKGFHLGAYFMLRSGKVEFEADNYETSENFGKAIQKNDDLKMISTGLIIKFGGIANNRVFIGGNVEIGLNSFKTKQFEKLYKTDDMDYDNILGLEINPNFVIDIFIPTINDFKISIPISAGCCIVPFCGRTILDYEDYSEGEYESETVRLSLYHFTPILKVGLSFGY